MSWSLPQMGHGLSLYLAVEGRLGVGMSLSFARGAAAAGLAGDVGDGGCKGDGRQTLATH